MVRVFLLLVVVQVVLAALALIDCLSAERQQVRALPRAVWVPVLLLLPLLGPIAWFLAGRPAPAGATRPAPPRRPAAPDDDPDFLRSIADSAREQDEELFRRGEDDLRRREEDLRRERGLGSPGDEPDRHRPDSPDRRTDPDQIG